MKQLTYKVLQINQDGSVKLEITLPSGKVITKRTLDFPIADVTAVNEDGTTEIIPVTVAIDTYLKSWYRAYKWGKQQERNVTPAQTVTDLINTTKSINLENE